MLGTYVQYYGINAICINCEFYMERVSYMERGSEQSSEQALIRHISELHDNFKKTAPKACSNKDISVHVRSLWRITDENETS